MNYKRELILEDVKTALLGITVANGFNTTVAHVDREVEIYDDLPSDKIPALFVVDGTENMEAMPGQRYRNRFVVGVLGYVKKVDGTKLSTTINDLVGDIKRKLHEDGSRGGNALTTVFQQVRVFAGLPAPRGVFEVDVLVTYDGRTNAP